MRRSGWQWYSSSRFSPWNGKLQCPGETAVRKAFSPLNRAVEHRAWNTFGPLDVSLMLIFVSGSA